MKKGLLIGLFIVCTALQGYAQERTRAVGVRVSLGLNLGVDYTFAFPIQLALDWRPEWTIINNFGTEIGWEVGFAVRLAF